MFMYVSKVVVIGKVCLANLVARDPVFIAVNHNEARGRVGSYQLHGHDKLSERRDYNFTVKWLSANITVDSCYMNHAG